MAKKKSGRLIGIALLAIVFVVSAYLLVKATKNQMILVAVIAACAVGVAVLIKPAKTATAKSRMDADFERIQAEARAKAEAERANEKRLVYKLRGVTFQGRQKWLEKIYYEEDGFTAPAIELESYEWEGKPACRVYVCPDNGKKPLDIGNIPAESVEEVLALTDRMTDAYVKVYGGPAYEGDDKSYGAELTIIYK